MISQWRLKQAATVVRQGGVIAYPTEAVFGLGCDPFDPAAVMRLLQIKRRDWRKGVILVASDWSQLAPLFPTQNAADLATLDASWPGPNTWLIPCRADVPPWLTGGTGELAVRVSANSAVQALCALTGPLVSTSANFSGKPAATTFGQLDFALRRELDCVFHGRVGGANQPSTIRRLTTGEVIRA